jgi:hypothetical protein
MTKINAKQVAQARVAVAQGMTDYAARSISACIRCSLRQREVEELLKVARELGVHQHPEFIV